MRSISSAVLLKRSKKSRRKCEAFRVPSYLREVRRARENAKHFECRLTMI